MRELKDSGVEWIGEIPSSWGIMRFKYFFDIVGGNGFKEEYQGEQEGDYPFFKASDINGPTKQVNTAKNYVTKERAIEERYNIIPANSILISKIGEALHKNHRKINLVDCIVDNNCEAFVLKTEDSIDYLYYIMLCIDMGWFDNGGTIPSVNNTKLKSFWLPYLPRKAQQEIAQYLDLKCFQIDSVIMKQQAVIEKLKEYKLSIITEAVIRGLDKKIELEDSGNKYLGQVPSHWSVVKFGRIATIKSNLVSPVEYQDYPQISPDNIDKGSGKLLGYNTVEESGVISWNHLFYTGQIIYSKIRPLLDKVIIAPFDGLCSADMYPIETDCNKLFIVFVILSTYFHAQVALVTETRVKMPKINQTELSNIVVAIPPVNEQNQIAECLRHKCERVDKIIEQRGKIIETLQKYKKSIVYEMVTGKREVL